MKRFLDLADFSREEIRALLDLARRLETQPEPQALAGKILGLVFFNPSLRTLASFQAGMARLGGTSFVITPGQGTWQLEMRQGAVMNGAAAEHVREGIPVLASYCDALGIRAFADGKDLRYDLAETAFNAMAAVVAEAAHQSRVRDEPSLPGARGLEDDGRSRRAAERRSSCCRGSIIRARCRWPCRPLRCTWRRMRGMEVVVLRPEGFALPPEIMDKARSAAAQSGGSVRETDDRRDALEGAHVVYAKEWGSTAHYGDTEGDGRLRAGLTDWCVRNDWFATAASDCRLMHCLPVRRNTAVADEVLDGPRSVVQREAYNRLTVQMAVLHKLLKGS